MHISREQPGAHSRGVADSARDSKTNKTFDNIVLGLTVLPEIYMRHPCILLISACVSEDSISFYLSALEI